MSSMTGSTLEELSTRESEMSIHETSFMMMQRNKTRSSLNDSNISIDSKSEKQSSGIFSSFFQSLIKPASPDDGEVDPEYNGSSDEDESNNK